MTVDGAGTAEADTTIAMPRSPAQATSHEYSCRGGELETRIRIPGVADPIVQRYRRLRVQARWRARPRPAPDPAAGRVATPQPGRRKNAVAVAVLAVAVVATSSPRSRASSSTMCGRKAGSLRRSFGIGRSVRGNR